MKTLLVGVVFSAVVATTSIAIAQTPLDGLRYVVQVRDSRGVPVPDGTVLKLGNAGLRPPATEEEARQASLRPHCAEGIVQGGRVEIVTQVREDCPQGMRVAGYVFPAGAVTGAGVEIKPEIEWRASRGGEVAQEVVASIASPHSAGDETNISPPNTGDAGLADAIDAENSVLTGTLRGGLPIFLAALVAVVTLRRRTPTV